MKREKGLMVKAIALQALPNSGSRKTLDHNSFPHTITNNDRRSTLKFLKTLNLNLDEIPSVLTLRLIMATLFGSKLSF